jgi:hypothetical protein
MALSRELDLAVRNLQFRVRGQGRGGSSPRPERFVPEDAERMAGCEMALDVKVLCTVA